MSKNLLYKATIVTTPTAYGVGVLNSIKPAYALGENLVINGDFATVSDWTISGESTISGGKANIISTAGVNTGVTQTVTMTTGFRYRFQYEVVSNNNGFLKTDNTDIQSTNLPSTVGVHFIDFNNTSNLNINFKRSSGVTDISIDNVSVKEVIDADFDFTRSSTATRVNPDYLIETSAIDTPRLDYHNGTASILLEPQSTNLITYSKDLTPYFTLDSGIILTLDYGVSPDGTINSTRLQYPSTNKGCYKVVAYAEATISLWVKGVINETILIGDYTYSASLTILTGDWQKIEVTSQISNIQISTYLGSTARDIQVWGAQLEQLSYATSYIPTSGTTQTRSAETLNNAGNSDLINSTEGVLYAEISALADDGTNRYISISDGTLNNRIYIYYAATINQIKGRVRIGGVTYADLEYTVSDITDLNKIAVRWDSVSAELYVNGLERETDLTGVEFSADTLTTFQFDQGDGGGAFFVGKCKTVAVFNEALTDTELACLTGTTDKEIFLNYYYRMQYVGANTEALGCAEQTFNI